MIGQSKLKANRIEPDLAKHSGCVAHLIQCQHNHTMVIPTPDTVMFMQNKTTYSI